MNPELAMMRVSLVVVVVLVGVPIVELMLREAAVGRGMSPRHEHSVVVLVSDILQSSLSPTQFSQTVLQTKLGL